MESYTIHPDILQAETMPGRFYHDAAAYAALKDKVFARSWQWVGVEQAVPGPGHVYPFHLLPGLLDEPLLLSRDGAGHIRCLSNVCTHRGNILQQKAGPCSHLSCRYHGRRFALDGTMEFMPGFEGVPDFPSPDDHLPQLELGQLGPFLFTSLRPVCTFTEWLDGLAERVGWLPLSQYRLDSTRSRTYRFAVHWALYVDNYLDGLHLPFVRTGSNAETDSAGCEMELFPWGSVQIGISRAGEPVFELPEGHPDQGKQVGAYYFWFFPNLMLNFYPWGLSLNLVQPVGLAETEVRCLTYVHDVHLLDQGAGQNLGTVESEDEEVMLEVQRGTASRLYDRGKYSPEWERGLHHFHRLLTRPD